MSPPPDIPAPSLRLLSSCQWGLRVYYLAVNVLKHGGGKSLRELERMDDQPFTLQDAEGKALIDVTSDGFLMALVVALRAAHDVLDPA